MNNGYLPENLEAILEALESDESDEIDESDESDELAERRRRRHRGHRPRTASGRGLVPPRPQAGYVTEARLEAAMAKVGAQIKTNSDAITGVNARLGTLSGYVSGQSTKLKKESEERKKDVSGLRNNVQMAALLPLLSKPSTKSINQKIEGTELEANDKVLVDKGDSLTALLPIIMLGGMGGSSDGSSSGSAGGFGGDSSMMLVLALALSQKGK